MTAALLFALILAFPLITACQEQTTTPLDSSAPSSSVPSNATQPDSENSRSRQSGSTLSGSKSLRRESTQRESRAGTERLKPQNTQVSDLRFLQGAGMAARLRGQSRDAFEHGLLPLGDYSDQLALALQIEIVVADLRSSETERWAALVAHAHQLEAAAGLLKQFNQPAARGWRADLSQAEFLSAAAASLASADGQSASSRAETRVLVSGQAQKYYQHRLSDFENGLASLSDLSRAASSLAGDVSNPENANAAVPGLIDYQTRMRQVLSNTEELARRGAAGGRIDHVREAQFELNRSTMLLAGLSKNEQAVTAAFQAADSAAFELQVIQSRLHDSGTALLFDMARSWSRWQELHIQAGQFDVKITESSNTQQQSQLHRLLQLADHQTDLRGRIVGDVTMVHSLKLLKDLRSLESDAQGAAPRTGR
jgi:hypothetical protein